MNVLFPQSHKRQADSKGILGTVVYHVPFQIHVFMVLPRSKVKMYTAWWFTSLR